MTIVFVNIEGVARPGQRRRQEPASREQFTKTTELVEVYVTSRRSIDIGDLVIFHDSKVFNHWCVLDVSASNDSNDFEVWVFVT